MAIWIHLVGIAEKKKKQVQFIAYHGMTLKYYAFLVFM